MSTSEQDAKKRVPEILPSESQNPRAGSDVDVAASEVRRKGLLPKPAGEKLSGVIFQLPENLTTPSDEGIDALFDRLKRLVSDDTDLTALRALLAWVNSQVGFGHDAQAQYQKGLGGELVELQSALNVRLAIDADWTERQQQRVRFGQINDEITRLEAGVGSSLDLRDAIVARIAAVEASQPVSLEMFVAGIIQDLGSEVTQEAAGKVAERIFKLVQQMSGGASGGQPPTLQETVGLPLDTDEGVEFPVSTDFDRSVGGQIDVALEEGDVQVFSLIELAARLRPANAIDSFRRTLALVRDRTRRDPASQERVATRNAVGAWFRDSKLGYAHNIGTAAQVPMNEGDLRNQIQGLLRHVPEIKLPREHAWAFQALAEFYRKYSLDRGWTLVVRPEFQTKAVEKDDVDEIVLALETNMRSPKNSAYTTAGLMEYIANNEHVFAPLFGSKRIWGEGAQAAGGDIDSARGSSEAHNTAPSHDKALSQRPGRVLEQHLIEMDAGNLSATVSVSEGEPKSLTSEQLANLLGITDEQIIPESVTSAMVRLAVLRLERKIDDPDALKIQLTTALAAQKSQLVGDTTKADALRVVNKYYSQFLETKEQ